MYYIVALFVGIITGGLAIWLYLMDRHAKLMAQVKIAESQRKLANEAFDAARVKQEELAVREHHMLEVSKTRAKELDQRQFAQQKKEADFERHVISYQEIQSENVILKRDLQNIDVNLNKLQMDGELREQKQQVIDVRATALAKRYLSETVKSVVDNLGPSNFSACKQRLVDVILRCREIGFEISVEEESKLLADLRTEFEREVRAAFAREEQARIKAQIREEEKLKREIDRELKQLDRERAAIQAALDQALAAAQGQHSAEVERLQARLAEAEEKSKRAISMAQQTKSGFVYIISNIGTFGLDVFKVGMTRRLDPTERIDELGSASVPFPYDVHAMIKCDNAPKLENALHRALQKKRINKANPRKEFFKVDLAEIIRIAIANHEGVVEYKAEPEALEYHQSLTMSEEDSLFIDQVYEAVEDETAMGTEDI
jgi:hypothetical protein